jgi:hypothetical protein
MTKDKYEAAYEAAIVAANAALTALKIEQAELYPPEGPNAWNNLSDAEKLDVYGALMLAEGAVAAAELKLKTYNGVTLNDNM